MIYTFFDHLLCSFCGCPPLSTLLGLSIMIRYLSVYRAPKSWSKYTTLRVCRAPKSWSKCTTLRWKYFFYLLLYNSILLIQPNILHCKKTKKFEREIIQCRLLLQIEPDSNLGHNTYHSSWEPPWPVLIMIYNRNNRSFHLCFAPCTI